MLVQQVRYPPAVAPPVKSMSGKTSRTGAHLFSQPLPEQRTARPRYLPEMRYEPLGTRISNRAPFPKTPFSRIVIPVMERISRDRKRLADPPDPRPLLKISSFVSWAIPCPLSSMKITASSPMTVYPARMTVAWISFSRTRENPPSRTADGTPSGCWPVRIRMRSAASWSSTSTRATTRRAAPAKARHSATSTPASAAREPSSSACRPTAWPRTRSSRRR